MEREGFRVYTTTTWTQSQETQEEGRGLVRVGKSVEVDVTFAVSKVKDLV